MMTFIFILAAIGVGETVYLIRKRIAMQHPVCFIGQSCEMVLTSKYSKMFFIPNDVLGLLACLAVMVLTALITIGIGPISFWFLILKVAVAVGSLMSLVFVFLMWKIIKGWCFWCVMSAFSFWLMGIILIILTFKL